MSKIPAKAIVKCKFEVYYTLEVPIDDMYASDRTIVETLCYKDAFGTVGQDIRRNVKFGLCSDFLDESGVKVLSCWSSSDPMPTGKQHTTRDWEITVDEEEAKRKFYGKELTTEAEAVIRTHVNAMQSATELSMRALNKVLQTLDLEVCKERSWQSQPEFYINDLQGQALGNADQQAFETPFECLRRFEHYIENELKCGIEELSSYLSIYGLFALYHWESCGGAGGLTREDFVAYDRKNYGVPTV